MVEHYANTEEFIYIRMWVCFAKGVGEGGFLCVCFCSDFLGGVEVGRGKVRGHQGLFVCFGFNAAGIY